MEVYFKEGEKRIMKKILISLLTGALLVSGGLIQPISSIGEEVNENDIPVALKLQVATLVTPDSFRVGIDEYVTGFLDNSVKKVVLIVNGETIRNGSVYTDGTFEVEAGDAIHMIDDKVEIVGLDRKNKELDRQIVSLEKAEIKFIAEDYALYDEEIRGSAGNQMSMVSLMINDELIRSVSVGSDDRFTMPVEAGDIIDTDDFVELVGSNSGKEVARIVVYVNRVDLQLAFNDFEFGSDTVIAGQLSGKARTKAKSVQLYVNRKRYAKVAVNLDGTFSVDSERNINNWKDIVTVAVLNESGEELGRFQLGLYKKYGTAKWVFDEDAETVVFSGGSFPDTGEWRNGLYHLREKVDRYIKKIIFTEPIQAAKDSSWLFANLDSLETIEGMEYLDVSKVENMSGMFAYTGLVEEPDLSYFDTSNVTDMSYMFGVMRNIKHLDLSSFNTSKVTDMEGMFLGVYDSGGWSLIESINLTSLDTSQVTNMSWMFSNLMSIKELNLSHFDTSKVEDMSWMFAQSTRLESLDISNFNTLQTKSVDYMFAWLPSIDRITVGKNTIFTNKGNGSGFFHEKNEFPYTGRWINNENANSYESSSDFIEYYTGSHPGTYMREVIE